MNDSDSGHLEGGKALSNMHISIESQLVIDAELHLPLQTEIRNYTAGRCLGIKGPACSRGVGMFLPSYSLNHNGSDFASSVPTRFSSLDSNRRGCNVNY